MKPHKLFGGFFHRRQCLVPTWQGCLLFVLLGIALMVTGVLRVNLFLAVTGRVPAQVLVVEGSVPDYVLEEARAQFERHNYAGLYITGGPLERGVHFSEYKTHGERGAATLMRMGIREDVIKAVPALRADRDRTYAFCGNPEELVASA